MSRSLVHSVIPSTLGACEALCRDLRRVLDGVLVPRNLFRAELMVREALANALEHGNHFDQSLKITVSVNLTAECLVIRVTDEGPGFHAGTESPALASWSPDDHGRGLSIIRHYARLVQQEDGGRTLRFDLPLELKE
jgi:anti-sigma regulatory factor (Ser/Thr protein kinase)